MITFKMVSGILELKSRKFISTIELDNEVMLITGETDSLNGILLAEFY